MGGLGIMKRRALSGAAPMALVAALSFSGIAQAQDVMGDDAAVERQREREERGRDDRASD